MIKDDKVDGFNEFSKKSNKKNDIIYSRMDKQMISRLHELRSITGISTSEIIREACRRLLAEVEAEGFMKLNIR